MCFSFGEPLHVSEVKEVNNVQAVDGGQYLLIAGTFSLMEKAKQLQNKVALYGFTPVVQEIAKNNTNIYRVIVGTYNDIDKANESKKLLYSVGIGSFTEKSIIN
jgi:cell division protein FtsN